MTEVNESVLKTSENRKRSFSIMSLHHNDSDDQSKSCTDKQEIEEKELNALRNQFIYNNLEKDRGSDNRDGTITIIYNNENNSDVCDEEQLNEMKAVTTMTNESSAVSQQPDHKVYQLREFSVIYTTKWLGTYNEKTEIFTINPMILDNCQIVVDKSDLDFETIFLRIFQLINPSILCGIKLDKNIVIVPPLPMKAKGSFTSFHDEFEYIADGKSKRDSLNNFVFFDYGGTFTKSQCPGRNGGSFTTHRFAASNMIIYRQEIKKKNCIVIQTYNRNIFNINNRKTAKVFQFKNNQFHNIFTKSEILYELYQPFFTVFKIVWTSYKRNEDNHIEIWPTIEIIATCFN